MNYEITEITSEKVCFSNHFETISFPQRTIDPFAKLKVGQEFEFNPETKAIPYSISRQRRMDIRAYHKEEAEMGNL